MSARLGMEAVDRLERLNALLAAVLLHPVLDGHQTVCVARAAPARIMNLAMPVGTRLPA
jgi:DNA-binding IclR family transcriptional regulator